MDSRKTSSTPSHALLRNNLDLADRSHRLSALELEHGVSEGERPDLRNGEKGEKR